MKTIVDEFKLSLAKAIDEVDNAYHNPFDIDVSMLIPEHLEALQHFAEESDDTEIIEGIAKALAAIDLGMYHQCLTIH